MGVAGRKLVNSKASTMKTSYSTVQVHCSAGHRKVGPDTHSNGYDAHIIGVPIEMLQLFFL